MSSSRLLSSCFLWVTSPLALLLCCCCYTLLSVIRVCERREGTTRRAYHKSQTQLIKTVDQTHTDTSITLNSPRTIPTSPSDHLSQQTSRRAISLEEGNCKKNSEPVTTSAFTAENQANGFIMIRTNDSQISECCQGAKLGRPIANLTAVCVC
jgi:hypothetical protein